ncbi:MAG: flagellar hook protein FlgE, partial [Paracoccaceae bacterium]
MTLSSSLNAGVAGLKANATRLATISDNIANSGTYGYKRAQADFHSQVINSGAGVYSAGGVRTTTLRLIDERGPLISTANATDIAISGRGMLPVTSEVSLGSTTSSYPLMLMTTGSFRPDSDGILVNETGIVLMGWPANVDGTFPTFPRDTIAGLVPIQVNINQYAADPTTTLSLGVNLPATETVAGASGASRDLSVEYYGNLGTSETLSISYTPTVPATGSSNTWTMVISDSASGGAVVGEYTLVFDATQANGGTLASVTTVSGGTYNAATGSMTLALGGGPLELTVGTIGNPNGMTQLSDSFAPVSITKNGSPVGNLTSVEANKNGFVTAIYDVGSPRTIYQIPLVDVPNPNGLISLDNQAYQVSAESGSFFLWDAGDGPAGAINGFTREESATDVA